MLCFSYLNQRVVEGGAETPTGGFGATFQASMYFQICASISRQRGQLFMWVRQEISTPPYLGLKYLVVIIGKT
jgi:hypothetical protein